MSYDLASTEPDAAHWARWPTPLARQAADRRKAFYARMDQHARTMASEQRAILAAVPRCPAPSTKTQAAAPPKTDEDAAPKQPSIASIQKAVAAFYGVSVIDIISARQTRGIVRPRHIAMYLARCFTARSLPEIGRIFGNRDHTTILSAARKIEALREVDIHLVTELAALEATLGVESAPPPQVRGSRIFPNGRIGLRYGLLRVVAAAPACVMPWGEHRHYWRCECDCGGKKTASSNYLNRLDMVHSCGCRRVKPKAPRMVRVRACQRAKSPLQSPIERAEGR